MRDICRDKALHPKAFGTKKIQSLAEKTLLARDIKPMAHEIISGSISHNRVVRVRFMGLHLQEKLEAELETALPVLV